ncbi:phosphoribosylamine--glycine ligase [Novosphingobium sp. TH158]|uniref:phosphoribosylamine--glycine ligase n=1 Tax=Novosphingobium sp. TH158 TaxID=2067455 RepID=UPI000C7AFCEF|nr:phosphoribosylamine--glycine ligase [Novosphingobium sp. TH158]PLK27262.1 phosphoribosylamine--glycine ligase [Novosphingobium sp. TH158]
MNILLIGSGGREHALAWKLAQSPLCETLYAAPGNPGMLEHAKLVTVDPADHGAVIAFCQEKAVSFVVIGPEAPLVDGLADSLRAAGIAVFGPSKAAAQLEGSKGFVKDLCAREGIPTAAYARHSGKDAALADLARFGLPVVIKADGLAAGKGVIIAETEAEAREAVEFMFSGGFGEAGAEVVIEEFMTGEEASFFAISDGTNVLPFGSAQDHKRVGDGDTGPNTGGMGAYSPTGVFTPEIEAEVMERIVRPTVSALARDNMPYQGVLFAGLMLTAEGPKLIEYNCRFGDPECQVLMMRFEGDLVDLLHRASQVDGLKDAPPVRMRDATALTVVMAARGYPGTPEKGGTIDMRAPHNGRVFHAGTATVDGQLVANGGRVLNVTALGANAREAQALAYAAVDAIDFPSGFCRRDIGWREVARESA